MYMFYNMYFIEQKFCLFKKKYYLCGVDSARAYKRCICTLKRM